MPLNNVTFVLNNPQFQDTLTVLRTPILPNGEPDTSNQTTFTISAVVQMGTVEPVILDKDFSHSTKAIVVHSQTRLYDVTASGPQSGWQPDIVTYTNTQYKVVKVWDFSRYGAGYYEADCEMISTTTQL